MPKKSDIALVVPTIREGSFKEFLSRWDEIGLFDHVDLYVIEDNPEKTFVVPPEIASKCGGGGHFSWTEIEGSFGPLAWIIPRRSDTVRSFGYYKAWEAGHRFILTLDDDCYPPGDSDGLRYDDAKAFLEQHLRCLTQRSRWFSTLNDARPRGIPYYNIGKDGSCIVNHGLWTNVLDYDAANQLVNPVPERFSFDSRVVPNGVYFPMCGMNVMWKAEATPLMYHLLMGQTIERDQQGGALWSKKEKLPRLKKLPFDRFGDIWCGIFMKRIADTMRLSVSTGMPYIRHERASNPFANLKKEANGIEVNERLWEYVDAWTPSAEPTTSNRTSGMTVEQKLALLYRDLGGYIRLYNDFPEYVDYFRQLGQAMITWAELFSKPSILRKAEEEEGERDSKTRFSNLEVDEEWED